MAPIWESSSFKHEIDKRDQIYAMLNATYTASVPEEARNGGVVRLFIGPEHAQTEREVEILVEEFSDGREARIFHAMHLGSKFRSYREEHPDG